MNIRKVNIKDFDDILNLSLQLEDTEAKFDDNLIEQCYATSRGKECLRKRIHNKKNICYVVTNENDKVIAFIDGNIPDDEWWYKDTVAYLNHICVDKYYRNQGIAKMLLNKFEMTAVEKGARQIRLLAFPQNKPAISFYTKNGFAEYSAYYNKKLN